MASCERCWTLAWQLGISYGEQVIRAEREKQECQGETLQAIKLRAGQFWDEKNQWDSRFHPEPVAVASQEREKP